MAFNPDDMFLCSWGDIQLFASDMQWEGGENQVVHDLAAGDLHPVQRRGSRIRKATVQLLFDDFSGAKETGIAAYRRFQASTKERRIFTHPMDGSFFAVIGEFVPKADANSVVTASCEFYPDAVVSPVSPAGAGTSNSSGESSVNASADVMAQKLSDQGVGFSPASMRRLDFSVSLDISVNAAFSVKVSATAGFSSNISATATATRSKPKISLEFPNVYAQALALAQVSDVTQTSGMASPSAFAFAMAAAALDADARASVASWTDENVSIRSIAIDAARLSNSIATMIELGGFERVLRLHPAFRAAILFGDSIRNAVVAATSETPSVFVIRLGRATSLLALAARTYGGADAQTRARQIAGMNDIRTPGWVDPGSYLMPARPQSSNSALLRDVEA